MPPVRTVDDVVERLRALDASLPRGDGMGAFNRVYLRVTEQVRNRIAAGLFDDPALMARLDVDFARIYLDAVAAVAAGHREPPAWEPLVAARRRPRVLAVQHVLAGMNAHINHDLAVAVVTTCGRARREPAAVHRDYERVNEVLAGVVRPIRQSFLDEAVVEAGAPLSPVADAVSAWSLDTARDAAWVSALTLWELRGVPPLEAAVRATLARTVGLVGRQLLLAR